MPQYTLDLAKPGAARIAKMTGQLPLSGSGGSEIFMFFGRINPDAASISNENIYGDADILTIFGLPDGVRVASVWMTEWTNGDFSHIGSAVFHTLSVQLEPSTNQCRVIFKLQWDGGDTLPAACMGFFGLFSGDIAFVP